MTSRVTYRRDDGPRFTALVVAMIAGIGGGLWLAVVLAGAFGLQ